MLCRRVRKCPLLLQAVQEIQTLSTENVPVEVSKDANRLAGTLPGQFVSCTTSGRTTALNCTTTQIPGQLISVRVERLLKYAVFVKYFPQGFALHQLFPRSVFGNHFFLRAFPHDPFDVVRNDDNAVKIRINQIPRANQHFTTMDWYVVPTNHSPTFRIQWPYARIVNRESDFNDLNAVADLAVANTSGDSPLLGNCGHQFAPRRICAIPIRRMYNNVGGIQQIHSLNLKAIRVLFNNARFHPLECSGAADKATIPNIGQ